jgi:hypothetical protein
MASWAEPYAGKASWLMMEPNKSGETPFLFPLACAPNCKRYIRRRFRSKQFHALRQHPNSDPHVYVLLYVLPWGWPRLLRSLSSENRKRTTPSRTGVAFVFPGYTSAHPGKANHTNQ